MTRVILQRNLDENDKISKKKSIKDILKCLSFIKRDGKLGSSNVAVSFITSQSFEELRTTDWNKELGQGESGGFEIEAN